MQDPNPSINVYDDLPADVPLGALQSILSYFGIHDTFDENGAKKWTISIQQEACAALRQEAVFESSTRSWTLRDRWRAAEQPNRSPTVPSLNLTKTKTPTSTTQRDDDAALPAFHCPDWTLTLPKTQHSDFFRSVDWAATPLKSLDTWPKSLRFYTHMVLSQKTPGAVYWGPEYTTIYNEGLIPLIGKAHPSFMGAGFMEVWQEIRSSFQAIFDQIRTTGIGIDLSDYNLFLDRNNYIEETWWRGNLFPLAQEDGSINGFCFMWNEATRQVLADRRTKLLNELSQFDVSGDGIWKHVKTTLRRNPRDIAMAILYSCDEAEPKQDRILHSEGAIGIGTDHVAAPQELNLDKSTDGFAPAMRKALESPHGWVSIDRNTSNFPLHILKGIDWQGYGEHSTELVIVPLQVVNNLLKGFVILGMNPRRAFDADHRQFVSDLQRQLITIMTTVTTQEQARQRETKLVADLAESERRIRHLAELAPMGLFDLSADGRMRWANSHYFSIMGIERPKNIADTAWIEPVDPLDLNRVEKIFKTCIENDSELAGTVRLSRKWQPPQSELRDGDRGGEHVHVYFQAFSYKENGITTSIMGSVTDVSRFVWAESVQARVADDAQRARQRQEEFIDIVSHELRNPLSAVTQCADGIVQSLRDLRHSKDNTEVDTVIETCTEAADSILLCAAHQKRIVDDVLTLSKLDSDLITLAPTKFQPIAIQKEAMQMFQSEFAANGIEVTVQADNGEFHSRDALICDPARVSQVLVNLLTNAIKFQKSDGDHRINIRYGISRERLAASRFGSHFQWSESKDQKFVDVTANREYGDGEAVYLYFVVTDNGQGLPRDQAVQIFDKFIQASRRTHVKYGGSGLGLYISRQLTEMQGGHIGVESEDGVGSTFAFYVKAKRATETSTLKELPIRSSPQVKPIEVKFEVLLVEDNLVNQKVLAKQLRKAGCTVHVANHGGEAIDFMLRANGHPTQYGTAPSPPPSRLDCILMDWEMPVLDGLAATERIRDLERQHLISEKQIILGVTANARAEQISTAMQAGMDAVITKPFRVPELTARIHELIAGRKTMATTVDVAVAVPAAVET